MTHIDSYEFGKITIDGKTYQKDLKIFPSKIKPNWWRKDGHYLQNEDLEDVFSKQGITRLIIGTGANGSMEVDDDVLDHTERLGIKIIIRKTNDACKIYNQLTEEQKHYTVLALHLTC